MNNPLSKPQLGGAQAGCYECQLTDQLIARMKAVGIDVSEAELRNAELNQFFRGILQQFSEWKPQTSPSNSSPAVPQPL